MAMANHRADNARYAAEQIMLAARTAPAPPNVDVDEPIAFHIGTGYYGEIQELRQRTENAGGPTHRYRYDHGDDGVEFNPDDPEAETRLIAYLQSRLPGISDRESWRPTTERTA